MISIENSDEYQLFHNLIQNGIGLFSEKINPNMIHFLCKKTIKEISFLTQSPLIGNYIFKNYSNPKEDGERYGLILKSSLKDKQFGLSYLLRSNTQIQNITLTNTNQKIEALDALKNYLIAAKFRSRIAILIVNATDELLMNAIFDAPIDELGRPLLSNTPRSTALRLENQKKVEISIGFDGNCIGVCVTDFFGSLDRSKIFNHFSKTYRTENYHAKASSTSAGIGLSTIFDMGGSFFFISEARVKTEATVLFKKLDNYVNFKKQFRFISSQFYY